VKGLSLSQTETTEAFDTTEAHLTISANRQWTLTVTDGAGWLSANPTSGGVGETRINFTLAKNETGKQRVGKVAINAIGETEPYQFTINQNPVNVLTGANEWIYSMMSGWYYWNDAVKAATKPANSLAYDEFLNELISELPWSAVQDNSNGEDPPTIDGRYARDANGDLLQPLERDHIYSYIERTAPETRASKSRSATFGFDFIAFYQEVGAVTYYVPLVIWVRDDSPAALAGMKRGTWITRYNGELINRTRLMNLIYQLNLMEGGPTMILTGEDGQTYDLTAVEMTATPILRHEVLLSPGGKKVAYLFYNSFERGDEVGGENSGKWEFDEQLKEVFAGFKAQGAQELVLDLRYNPGGYVSSSQLLSSLAANVNKTMIFAQMQRNAGIRDFLQHEYGWKVPNPEVMYFLDEANSLKLGKVYVLATEDSASAAEMVISSLRGVLGRDNVVHIGTTTNGKNVGMDLIEPLDSEGEKRTIDGYNYEMWPITFKVLNAENFCNYAGGLEPNPPYQTGNYYLEELNGVGAGGPFHPLGDPDEALLKAALDLIDGKPFKPATRADDTAAPKPVRLPKDPRKGGAKYIPQKPVRPATQ
jgi:C-terminal processing protease CtpA/Prc